MSQINVNNGHQYQQQFSQINQLLEQSCALWQVQAFEAKNLPWEADFPCLARAIWAIDDAEIDTLDADQTRLVNALAPALRQDLTTLGLQWELGLLAEPIARNDGRHLATDLGLTAGDEAHFSAHIKGRKWEQISAFVRHLPKLDLPVLEWCAGKGHLGRLLAKTRQVDVVSLEWQATLCQEGQAFADKWQLSQQFICADAFEMQVSRSNPATHKLGIVSQIKPPPQTATPMVIPCPLVAQQQAVALHACGDLHVRLLTLAAQVGTQALAISPCCYHLIQTEHYQSLSSLGKSSALTLSRHDLQLPLQQSVIASPKQQALRHQEIAWRLGFDALQRQCRGRDHYLPIPSIKQSQLSGSFKDFCLWAGAQKSVDLPHQLDWDAWLALGLQRQRLTRRIDLVAHLFRRVLEQWLILDRVCFLQEQGYLVEVVEFCANSVTPRNALILAIQSVD